MEKKIGGYDRQNSNTAGDPFKNVDPQTPFNFAAVWISRLNDFSVTLGFLFLICITHISPHLSLTLTFKRLIYF